MRNVNSKILKAICLLTSALCLLTSVLYPLFSAPAYAGLAVSVTGGDWAVGDIGMGITSTTAANKWTITGSDNVRERIYIKVDGTNWHPASAAGDKVFVLKHNGLGAWSSVITNSGNGVWLKSLGLAGTGSFGLQFIAPTASTSVTGEQTLTVTLTATIESCDASISVTHTAGTVAPVTKSVTYGIISSPIGGTGVKCWITQNLGATNQAGSATDSTEASAGWYWQFNRKQGYYQPNANGALISTATPNTWNATDDNTACDPVVSGTEWCPVNDPCTLLLGAGWRLPTYTEWLTADGASGGNWSNRTDTYNSVLKLHAAGYLFSNGTLYNRGSSGYYWSSTQASATLGRDLYFSSSSSYMIGSSKAYGFSVRCLRD